MSYIYQITNRANGKQYVGKAARSVNDRWLHHKWSANRNSQTYLARALRKYGSSNFTVETLEVVNNLDDLAQREIDWIKRLNTLAPNGYNLTTGGDGCVGRKLSDETKMKLRDIQLGRKRTPEQIEAMRQRSTGRKATPDTLRKMSEAAIGHPVSEETRNKLRIKSTGRQTMLGKHHSSEAKEAMRLKAYGRTLSEDARNKLAREYFFLSPSGNFTRVFNLCKFCKENELNPSHMCAVHKGRRDQHKGWRKATNSKALGL